MSRKPGEYELSDDEDDAAAAAATNRAAPYPSMPEADMQACKQALADHGGDVEAATAALAPTPPPPAAADAAASAVEAAAATPIRVSEAALERLQQLGFDETRCREALVKHGGDETKAEDWLLSN